MKVRVRLLTVFVVLLLNIVTFSSISSAEIFESNRLDSYVPDHCRHTRLTNFKPDDIEYFTYGIRGASQRGFTHEYPIERGDARFLWGVFKNNREEETKVRGKIRHNDDLKRDFHILSTNREPMDFSFKTEGEILELLAIVALYERINTEDNDYFITGGIEYHEPATHRTVGELDLVVGHRASCKVIAVGETKLGLKSLSKARQQLARFRDFLRAHSPFEVLNRVLHFGRPHVGYNKLKAVEGVEGFHYKQ